MNSTDKPEDKLKDHGTPENSAHSFSVAEEIRDLMAYVQGFAEADVPMPVHVVREVWNRLSDLVSRCEEKGDPKP